MNNDDITAITDAEREALVAEAIAIREYGEWVQYDGTRWLAMRIGELAITGEGATAEEAIETLRTQEVQEVQAGGGWKP